MRIFRHSLPAVLTAVIAIAFAAFAAPAMARDTNHDKLPDRWENKNHLSLKVKQTRRDPDHDKLNNLAEYRNGTDPHNPDTDGDGIPDGAEVAMGLDPTDPDSDGDGTVDGQDIVGVISSFDGTNLVIQTVSGATISGTIDENTYIGCDRSSPDEDLDGVCLPSDLQRGVEVSDAEFDGDNPSLFDEVDLVNVF
jgi:Bacterial TSP3 repeat